MAALPHYIHIYQKPALGNSFLTRKPVYNYTHTISAMGWYDTASCNLRLTSTEAEIAFESWIDNRVAVFVDNPAYPIWEGLITRVTPEFGNVVPTRSTDAMFNRSTTTYTGQGTNNVQTTAGNTTDSQAIYGIKHGNLEIVFDTTTSTRDTTIRDFVLAWQSWPQSSLQFSEAGRMVRVEMLGMYHTLDKENIRVTGVVDRTLTTLITNLIGALGNGATFFDNTITSLIETNTITSNENTTRGETAWQQVMKWAETGDGTNRWIAGITPTDPNTGLRALYFRDANTAVEYTANARDGARIRNAYGGLVNAWNVLPDRTLRVNDILVGWSGMGDDPREIYIESVNYDAESQRVALTAADDVTTDGVIQAKRFAKMSGSRFGHPPRMTIN